MSDELVKRLRMYKCGARDSVTGQIDSEAAADLIEQQAARIAELEAQIAAVAPAVDAQPVAWRHKATKILRNDSIAKGADFEPADWEPLYTAAQSEGLRKDADLSLRALYEDACIKANKNAQDAARWRYAVRHWLDEHIATKQADEAIVALSKQDPQ